MESLAIIVALIVFSSWGLAAASLFFSFVKLKLIGAILGAVSILVGIWFISVLPHAPFFGVINLIAGGVAVKRYFSKPQ